MNAHNTSVISGRVLHDTARQHLDCESGAEATAVQTLARGPRDSRIARSVWSAACLPPLSSARDANKFSNDCARTRAVLKPPHSKRWRD